MKATPLLCYPDLWCADRAGAQRRRRGVREEEMGRRVRATSTRRSRSVCVGGVGPLFRQRMRIDLQLSSG